MLFGFVLVVCCLGLIFVGLLFILCGLFVSSSWFGFDLRGFVVSSLWFLFVASLGTRIFNTQVSHG